jgi:8-oxo-dGTP pyrophosphatase MutT (NUDIX family)
MNNHIKKFSPCLNCGKMGHEQRQCREPIKSWGIILIKFDNKLNHKNTNIKKYENLNGIRIQNKEDLIKASEIMEDIKFLLVRRKHSLGFSEFMRGKYVVGNINGIRGLFNQMVPEEIEMIRKNTFDQLWNYFWNITPQSNQITQNNQNDIINSDNYLSVMTLIDSMNHEKIYETDNETDNKGATMNIFNKKEYYDSKNKFMMLKSRNSLESDLDFYLDTADPIYFSPEWGFPKGRKKRGESDLECAIREFCEETDIKESDINVLKNIKPIEEELIGTNGVKYKHIYYLAELNANIVDLIKDEIKNSNSEIGDIGFFTYNDSINLIREYHVEKKKILKCIMNYYMDLIKKNTEKDDEWVVEDDEFQLNAFPMTN